MAQTFIPYNNRGLISTFGQYYSRTSNSVSGIFGTATLPNQALSNVSFNAYGYNGYLLYINIKSTNSTKGNVSITYPFSVTSTGTEFIGNDRQVSEAEYGSIEFQANTTYPYTFNGWYTEETGGTFLSSTSAQSYYDGVYTGLWYARWN
jgi:hypothetical protein